MRNVPTANTVTGVEVSLKILSSAEAIDGSPAPWKVRATFSLLREPWLISGEIALATSLRARLDIEAIPPKRRERRV